MLSCSSLLYARGGGVPTLTLKESFEFDLVQAVLESADVLRITNLPAPFSSNIGLVFDGTSSVYIDDTFSAVIVDAATGTVGPPPTLGGLGRMPHAGEGGDVWGLCGCGGNEVASRSTPTGTVVDEVETTALLGSPSFLVALAVPTPGQLPRPRGSRAGRSWCPTPAWAGGAWPWREGSFLVGVAQDATGVIATFSAPAP